MGTSPGTPPGLMSRSLHLKHTGRSPTRPGFIGSSSLLGQVLLDHPRSRGVYDMRVKGDNGLIGSSPLARGLPFYIDVTLFHRRIIPARAGFTVPQTCTTIRLRDHPRSRGVYTTILSFLELLTGSSPLARGLLVKAGRIEESTRIIPARAGFTYT